MAARNLAVREMPLQARMLRGRGRRLSRPGLEQLEAAGFEPESGELYVSLAWLVSGSVPVDEGELNAARRRAMFVLAAGGDPHRELDLNSVAADRLADELDAPDRREALAGALVELDTRGLASVAAGVAALLAEPDLAWRSFGLALLADE